MTMQESRRDDPLTQEERERSNFIKELVQHPLDCRFTGTNMEAPPRRIVQFWDDLARLPEDVHDCMESWKKLEQFGFTRQIFDENTARSFIRERLGARYAEAFDRCYHPSMKSDYFRYSYIFIEGGMYVDADDVYLDVGIDQYFVDGRLKLQPFCYDISTSQMVPPSEFLIPGANKWGWIFYFNTTPLIAPPNHLIVGRALTNATEYLEQNMNGVLPEVQASTGPGNLTRSVFEVLSTRESSEDIFLVAKDWEKSSTSKWQLSYRNDQRNWRLSNQRVYRSSQSAGNP